MSCISNPDSIYSYASSRRSGPRRVAGRRDTLSFVQKILHFRKNEYHADIQEYQPSQQVQAGGDAISASRSFDSNLSSAYAATNPSVIERAERQYSQCCAGVREKSRRRGFFRNILNSHAWKAGLVIFSLILLFGAQCRAMFIPQEGDDYLDAIFICSFVFFVCDMVMRIDAEQHYFSCRNGIFPLGSFLFWCDFLSTLTLLYDISFINRPYFGEQRNEIEIDSFGIPISGLEEVNSPRPFRLNGSLLVTIGQTARVGRFIRSSRAVKLSSKVNWYLLMDMFNPMWWIKKCRKSQSSSDANESTRRLSDGSEGQYSRRATWGGISMTALAAAKANSSFSAKQSGLRGYWSRLLGLAGLRSNFDNEDVRRQVAATRIQRAWRNALKQRQLAEESTDFVDVAWKGRSGAANNPMERQLRQRSIVMKRKSARMEKKSLVMQKSNLLSEVHEEHRSESQVGSAMRELTGQRVAIGIIVALLLTVIFTYVEEDATRATTMIVLHNQTGNAAFADRALEAARSSVVPDLFAYTMANGVVREYDVVEGGESPSGLRPRERLRITVSDYRNQTTVGVFSYREERQEEALISLLSMLFILLVWFCGVTAFAGPVMVLVVIPIERMVRLLTMLMVDPLGYQGTSRYKRFVDEENEITKNTRWTKEILKGMETSFLMSTILRIGSLMQVGFGSAGVNIIRNNLEPGQSQSENMLILSSQGSTVSCIFLFCDIRSFTDATECLQEEVFVFTNRIAAVVHSNCHAYGGSANKNVGDAFLLSWSLEEDSNLAEFGHDSFSSRHKGETFVAKHNQADKALLSVVKICMALQYNDYYLETMTEGARQALLAKLKSRKGPVVQMGFGLHAGRAVQGAIGSQRKIDATYVSEAVERAEFLESSTKKYGLKMLMSDSFHRLLQQGNRRRCRKVDQILIEEEEGGDEYEEDILNGEIMELFTFDIDIESLWGDEKKKTPSDAASDGGSRRSALAKHPRGKRMSFRRSVPSVRDDFDEASQSGPFGVGQSERIADTENIRPSELVLPTGPALYSANVWMSEDMRTIRQLYSDGLFFQKFNSGLQSFYAKDWDHAKQCFAVILERFEDGPSRYFMNQIENHKGKPPRNFLGYGR